MPDDVNKWTRFLDVSSAFYSGFLEGWGDMLAGLPGSLLTGTKDVRQDIAKLTRAGAEKAIRNLGLPEEQEAMAMGLIPEIPVLDIIAAIFLALGARGTMIKEVFGILNTAALYTVNSENPWRILTPQEMGSIIHRKVGATTPYLDLFKDWGAKQGYNPEAIAALIEAQRAVLGPGEAVQAQARELILPEEYARITALHGLTTEQATVLANLGANWPDMNTINELARRGVVDEGEYTELFSRLGFPPKWREQVKTLRHRTLGADTIRDLYWRKAITKDQRNERLVALGFNPEDLPAFDVLWDPTDPFTGMVPQFQDVITMAVRDAFSDDAARSYGLDVNYPPVLSQFADLTGFGEYWAKMYWRAHWQLPSPQMAFQMLYKADTFGLADLRKLLTYADYPPYLIDPLIQAAHVVPSRVDVRRMYREGVYNYPQVVKAYERLGYAPDDASDLADFAVLDAEQETTGTASGHVLRALRDGYIDEAQARNLLVKVGMSGDKIAARITGALVEQSLDMDEQNAKAVEQAYVRGGIDLAQAAQELQDLGYPQARVQMLLTSMQVKKRMQVRRPTMAQFSAFLKGGLLTREEYVTELRGLGYPDRYIVLFLSQAEGK